MRAAVVFFSLWSVLGSVYCTEQTDQDKAIQYLTNTVHAISRQVMLQQFFNEERIRTEGSSGLKQIRIRRGGSKNYFTGSHTGISAAAIHDHANNIRTVGMGEFVAVLNGIEFRTRHNDYRLYKPHPTSTKYHIRGHIPFPPVPPQVSSKPTVEEQILEMREYFKAWADQKPEHREYRPYFKPVLCYLEGAWTKPSDKIDEPFHSDRHFIDAKDWFDLMDKIRFTSYTAGKSRLENLSFLPTKLMGFINNTLPLFAQWNYRILCHPLKDDLPTARLRVVEDLGNRMAFRRHITHHRNSRAARFQLNPKDQDYFFDRLIVDQYLDKLMGEIPGKNNYAGNLMDEGFENMALNLDGSPKDASRYHRWYRLAGRDAMGVSTAHRGYGDDSMFVAMTTQDQIAGLSFQKCTQVEEGGKKVQKCRKVEQKFSYAIPLEIIYMTPLYSWNPYNIEYKGEASSKTGRTVAAGGRNGQCSDAKAYNGIHSRLFYQTPALFYNNSNVNDRDAADTAQGDTCVLDKTGTRRIVRASGTRIFTPSIQGVGVQRLRYPIFPVHGEGSSVWKELNAVKDLLAGDTPQSLKDLMKWDLNVEVSPVDVTLRMSKSQVHGPNVHPHTHYVTLTPIDMKDLANGHKVSKITTQNEGHTHILILVQYPTTGQIKYYRCTGLNYCRDGHPKLLVKA